MNRIAAEIAVNDAARIASVNRVQEGKNAKLSRHGVSDGASARARTDTFGLQFVLFS